MVRIRASTRLFAQTIALLAAIGAIGSLLNLNDEPALGPSHTSDPRQLGIFDPKTVKARVQPPDGLGPLAVNIYIAKPQKVTKSKLFYTDVFSRYTTGRIKYNIVEYDYGGPHVVDQTAPCIAVVGNNSKETYDAMKEKYPHCKIMVTSDEKCHAHDEFDIRHYYVSTASAYYLPLGMRFDSWSSLRKIRARRDFVMKPPSQRKYALNAMFSKSTNKGREGIATMLEENDGSPMSTYIKLNEKWSTKLRGPSYSDGYMNVLVESAFTVSPDGNNPECYRHYEAIEAGSIPVLLKGRASFPRGQSHMCKRAMMFWYSSPVVLLDSWEDLYPTVQKLIEDPVKLDELYTKVRAWYDEKYMGKLIPGFEDYIIESYAQDGIGGSMVTS